MKLKIPDLNNQTDFEEFRRFASSCVSQIRDVINGRVSLTDNCETSLVSVTFSAAGDQDVKHQLGRTPQGYIVAGRSANISLFDGSGERNTESISIQSDGAGSASLLIF